MFRLISVQAASLVQPEYSNGRYIKTCVHFGTNVGGMSLKVYQREKTGEEGMSEISATFVRNFRLSIFRKKRHHVYKGCLLVTVFLAMVVHEKYQQHLWNKFLKMLLMFLMYQHKCKGKSIPHRPVSSPED